MLDMERIREHPEALKRMLASRYLPADEVDGLLKKDALRRRLIADSQEKKALRNQMSRKVGEAKRRSAVNAELEMITGEMRALGSEIAVTDADIAELDDKINAFLTSAPNYPHASVPVSRGEKNNAEIYHWGTPRTFGWEPKPYWNIGSNLKILDFDNTAKQKGTRFTVYRDLGAQLERALINFILDTYIRAGYREVITPYLVSSDGTNEPQPVPIFEAPARKPEAYRIPESEPSVAGLYRDTVLDGDQLPVSHCAFSATFHSDVNASVHDSGGLIQQHEYHKVELATLCRPENSYDELTRMTEQAQSVLKLLGLPYRVMLLCTGELAFSAAKTYHLEVWMPSYQRYIQVSCCSNCEDYQARALGIRYRDTVDDAPRYCHTLGGSGMVIGRTMAAILETHQNEDGSVSVPEALRPYMPTDIIR